MFVVCRGTLKRCHKGRQRIGMDAYTPQRIAVGEPYQSLEPCGVELVIEQRHPQHDFTRIPFVENLFEVSVNAGCCNRLYGLLDGALRCHERSSVWVFAIPVEYEITPVSASAVMRSFGDELAS